MKQRLKAPLVIAGIVMTLLMTVPLLGCATQAGSGPEPEALSPPTITSTTPEAPSSPTVPPLPAETENPTPPETAGTPASAEAVRVDVVYFHRAKRCHSCMYTEEQTRLALESYFAGELESGEITFTSVDVQDESNADIIEKYEAYASQLFINAANGDTERIEEVIEFWDFIDDDEGFSLLIRTRITNALEGAD